MKMNAAAIALALLPVLAHAKCAERTYLLEGRVEDEAGRPVVGALVGASWLEFGQPAGPLIAVTDGSGRYRLSVRFRPGDDMPILGDGCTERLQRISVVAQFGDGAQRLAKSPFQMPIRGCRT